MISMRFDYRDLFRAPRIAWSFQRIWIQFLGLLSGWAVYFIFTYLALLLAGEHLSIVWARFGLIPSIAGLPLPWYAWIFAGIGILGFLFCWLVSATGVCRAVYMNLKGNHFYTWKDAIRFAFKKKGGAVIATPIVAGFTLAAVQSVNPKLRLQIQPPGHREDLPVGLQHLAPWGEVELAVVLVEADEAPVWEVFVVRRVDGEDLALGREGVKPVLEAAQQEPAFGRVYAAYGGIFVVLSLLWGRVVDGWRPDRYDLVGAAIALVGVLVIMWGRRWF